MKVHNGLLGGSEIEWDEVPQWVYMAEVPPPADAETWTRSSRRRSGTLMVACFLGALLVLAAAVAWKVVTL